MISNMKCSKAFLLLAIISSYLVCRGEEIVVAGYLPDYRFYINLKEASLHLTYLIIFSIEPSSDGKILDKNKCCLDKSHFEQAREAKKFKKSQNSHSSDLKLIVAVGGAGRSEAFSKIVSSKKLQDRFIEGLKDLCLKEGLDGIDYDWEGPSNEKEMKQYSNLIKETYKVFHPLKLLVSVALHPNQYLSSAEYYASVDSIHVMTYDMITYKNKERGTFHHHAKYDHSIHVLQTFVSLGCPKEKIVMGIPAYARHYKNPGSVKTFAELVDEVEKSKGKNFDLQQLSKFNGFELDSPNTVKEKVAYVLDKGFKGVFFWEIGQDKQNDMYPGGILLEAAAHEKSSNNAENEL